MQEGLILTEARMVALEKAKETKERMGNSRANVLDTVELRIPFT